MTFGMEISRASVSSSTMCLKIRKKPLRIPPPYTSRQAAPIRRDLIPSTAPPHQSVRPRDVLIL